MRRKKYLWVALGVAVLLIGWRVTFGKKDSGSITRASFEYTEVAQRTIKAVVSANGNLNPASVVSVGAQVNGKVEKIYVDFNSRVTPGQLLAEIDKSLLSEDVAAADARLKDATQSYKLAQLNERRFAELFEKGYIAQIEHDQVLAELAGAYSNYITARANLERAQINLSYAEIRSPVSGVVISKDVEEGQTIASSFSAPTLFTIAEDLSKMQISASISEADIGAIKSGQDVDFTVDAYPTKTFMGKVDQVRLNPTNEQNVVVYSVIINIDNKDGLLLPGMTAFVEINTKKKEGVPSVPNTAFAFRPAANVHIEFPLEKQLARGEAFLYAYDAAARGLRAVKVRRGITDGRFTEIEETELKLGDMVVVEIAGSGVKRASSSGSRGGGQGGRQGGQGRGPI